MLIVTALGGNALLRRGQPMTAQNQRDNVRIAAQALAPVAAEHDLVVGHGNGPQVGLLALQGAAYTGVETYPLDVLDAQTEGAIGYMIEQELGNLLPFERPFATLLTMIEVDPNDPAFANPTKFIGPVYDKPDADRLAKWLLEKHTIVIAAGGGGIPTAYDPNAERRLVGVECVIDKDLATELLARELGADLYVMLTDADAVYVDWGTPAQRAIRRASPDALSAMTFAVEEAEAMELAAGSMGPKVDAACRFARATGKRAAIGELSQLGAILAGSAGTTVDVGANGIVYG